MVRNEDWREDLEDWAAGWAAVSGDGEDVPTVSAWDGRLPEHAPVVIACEPGDVDAVRAAAASSDRAISNEKWLVAGDTEDLDRGLGFPGEAGLFDAPMGEYTRFEVDEWGHPVAHSTLSVRDEVGFVGPLVADGATERDPAEVLDPLVSSIANEAFLADAQRLYTLAKAEELPTRQTQGWEPVAVVLWVE